MPVKPPNLSLLHYCSTTVREKAYYENARRPITKGLGLVHTTSRAGRRQPPLASEVRSWWLVSRIATENWLRFREN